MMKTIPQTIRTRWKTATLVGTAGAVFLSGLSLKSSIDHDRAQAEATTDFFFSLKNGDGAHARELLHRFPEISKAVDLSQSFEPRTALETAIVCQQQEVAKDLIQKYRCSVLDRIEFENSYYSVSFAVSGKPVVHFDKSSETQYIVTQTSPPTTNPFSLPTTLNGYGFSIQIDHGSFLNTKSVLFNTSCNSDPQVVEKAVQAAAMTGIDLSEAFADGEFHPVGIPPQDCERILRENLPEKDYEKLLNSTSPGNTSFREYIGNGPKNR